MKQVSTLVLLPVGLVLAGGIASADHVQIKYHSGKVQILRLDEPCRSIASISYQEGNAVAPPTLSPAKANGETVDGAEKTPQKNTGTSPANDKPPARIEWAPPVE